ncbi:MAG: CdaR family protein [Culicoidibacterales bacterium]
MSQKPKKEKKRTNFTELKLRLTQLSRFLSNKFEQLFTNSKFTVIVTFLLALLLVQSIQSSGSITVIKQVSSIARNQEVTADYDRDKFVIEGLPDKADVVLLGDEAAIQSTKTTNSYSVFADLTSYGAGEHLINMTVENLPNNVQAQINPSTVKVSIYTREFKVFDVSTELINTNEVEGLTIENPVLAEQTVSLKGAAKDLRRIAFVRALIDGKTINASLNNKAEGLFEGRAVIAAYDASGNRVSNVTIDSGGIDYTVNLVVPKGKPISNLTNVFQGNFPEGQAIKSVVVDTEVITVNGADNQIAKITALDINYDLKTISRDGKIEGTVVVPQGVGLTSITPSKVTATLTFGPAMTKNVEISGISTINGDDRLKYDVDNTNQAITVAVTGTEEQLAVFRADMIDVRANVLNFGEGVQTVSLEVVGPTIYRYEINQTTIRLKITKK